MVTEPKTQRDKAESPCFPDLASASICCCPLCERRSTVFVCRLLTTSPKKLSGTPVFWGDRICACVTRSQVTWGCGGSWNFFSPLPSLSSSFYVGSILRPSFPQEGFQKFLEQSRLQITCCRKPGKFSSPTFFVKTEHFTLIDLLVCHVSSCGPITSWTVHRANYISLGFVLPVGGRGGAHLDGVDPVWIRIRISKQDSGEKKLNIFCCFFSINRYNTLIV